MTLSPRCHSSILIIIWKLSCLKFLIYIFTVIAVFTGQCFYDMCLSVAHDRVSVRASVTKANVTLIAVSASCRVQSICRTVVTHSLVFPCLIHLIVWLIQHLINQERLLFQLHGLYIIIILIQYYLYIYIYCIIYYIVYYNIRYCYYGLTGGMLFDWLLRTLCCFRLLIKRYWHRL